jgi:hypothetical protein
LELFTNVWQMFAKFLVVKPMPWNCLTMSGKFLPIFWFLINGWLIADDNQCLYILVIANGKIFLI